MSAYLQDGDLTLHHGDAATVLTDLPEGSVDCVVTSPPYFGLRDYGIGDVQIGLEPTPEEYVAALVGVFREVRRVLAPWGTCWVNIGDSYAGTTEVNGARHDSKVGALQREGKDGGRHQGVRGGAKPKDLLMMPARLALALQADGWWVRSRIVWAKPNPMPESVTDRPTSAHEDVYLLTKAPRYYYDAEAVREPVNAHWLANYQRNGARVPSGKHQAQSVRNDGERHNAGVGYHASGGRNLRNVWSIATEPTPEAHFATFPTELVRRCLAAGCPERVCRECGEPSRRIVERGGLDTSRPQARRALEIAENRGLTPEHLAAVVSCGVADSGKAQVTQNGHGHNDAAVQVLADEAKAALGGYYREFLIAGTETTGWTDCGHDAWRPGIVLDPFIGSGTTALVARRLGLHAVGIDASAEYLAIAEGRLLADRARKWVLPGPSLAVVDDQLSLLGGVA